MGRTRPTPDHSEFFLRNRSEISWRESDETGLASLTTTRKPWNPGLAPLVAPARRTVSRRRYLIGSKAELHAEDHRQGVAIHVASQQRVIEWARAREAVPVDAVHRKLDHQAGVEPVVERCRELVVVEQRRCRATEDPHLKEVDARPKLNLLDDVVGNFQIGGMRPLAIVRLIAGLEEEEVLSLRAQFLADVLDRWADHEPRLIRSRHRRAVARKPDVEPLHGRVGDKTPTNNVFRFVCGGNKRASRSKALW